VINLFYPLENGISVSGSGTQFRSYVGIYGVFLSDDQSVVIGLEDSSRGIEVGFKEKAFRSAYGKDPFCYDLLRSRRFRGGRYRIDKF